MSAPHNFDRMTYGAEEYRTARKCAAIWNEAKCPTDRQAIEWTLQRGGAWPLVEVRNGVMFASDRCFGPSDAEIAKARASNRQYNEGMTRLWGIDFFTQIPVPVEFVRDIVVQPWTDAPTAEEAHVAAMQMREAF